MAQESDTLPRWMKWFALERMATGLLLIWIGSRGGYLVSYAMGGQVRVSSLVQSALIIGGIALVAGAVGLIRRQRWAQILLMTAIVLGGMASIMLITIVVLSWPHAWGRWAIACFIFAVALYYFSLALLFSALMRAGGGMRRVRTVVAHSAVHARQWGGYALMLFVAIRLAAWQGLGFGLTSMPPVFSDLPSQEENSLHEAITYCTTLTGRERAQRMAQVAFAAREAGDTLPDDFCASLTAGEPQLAFLCIAYAGQASSCNGFPNIRDQALCRGLVTADPRACDTLTDPQDADTCRDTVMGYLDALQEQTQAPSAQ